MSKLARALTLAAIVATVSLAPLTAVAQTHASDHATRQDAKRRSTAPQQAAADAAHRRLLAQERYYSTWDSGHAATPAPAEPSGQPVWLLIALSVLAVGALVAGVAVLAARRANRGQRAGQTA